MAIVDSQGFVRGKLNDEVIYRKLNGKNVLQYKPAEVKRSFKAKLAAHEFGIASNVGKAIRMLAAKPKELRDANMHARLNTLLTKSLRRVNRDIGERDIRDIDPADLIGFQFNMDAPFEKTLNFPLRCHVSEEGIIHFTLPRLADDARIAFLKTRDGKNAKASFDLMVARMDLQHSRFQLLERVDIEPSSQEGIEWEYCRRWEKDNLILLFVSLSYYMEDWAQRKIPLSNKAYNSSGILASFFVNDELFSLNQALPGIEEKEAISAIFTFDNKALSKRSDIKQEIKRQNTKA
ncbi:hypothetical protein [Olivibacter sitiensis]|uniref:hypothetical protein n=1 Tax=Olivibacter sitiensis TaxID=376470 RepID=UPI00040832F9|nr:hypothetical protein [Olivibacter sitiensis]